MFKSRKHASFLCSLKVRNRKIHFILYKNLDELLVENFYLVVEVAAVMEAVVVAAVVKAEEEAVVVVVNSPSLHQFLHV
jgi:hypothetical protein